MKTLYLLDFDGTLSMTDSAKYFFRKVANPFVFYCSIYILPFILILKYFLFRGDNFSIKKARLKNIFRYSKELRINDYYSNSDNYIDEILKPGALKYIRELSSNSNNDVYIVSASFSFILEKWAKRENIGLLTNNIEFKNNYKNIRFLNDFDCDGIGKALLIKQSISLTDYGKIVSYGDSMNDFHMFLLSDNFYYKPTF
jgi:HAD superfamily phosphoserine phosphatase-like hydrolase